MITEIFLVCSLKRDNNDNNDNNDSSFYQNYHNYHVLDSREVFFR
jgi:hypothetical protein